MFPISAFADMAGVSAKALRHYDRLGLFAPAWVDPASAYRYYSAAQLPALRRILALRDTGMPLAAIRAALRGGDDLRQTLKERRGALERERREIDRRLAALEIRLETERFQDDVLDVVVRAVPREPVATLAISRVAGGDVSKAFYELEMYVRDLGRRAHRPPGGLIPAPGAGEPGDIEVYVPLTGPIQPTARIGYRVLRPGRAATVMHRGSYRGVGRVVRQLERWAASAGLARDGALRLLYLQFGAESELALPDGWVVDDPADYVTEIQLPVA